MLTGFYPHRTGVMGNVGALGGEPLQLPTIGQQLQEAGYTTGYFGKWHLGTDPQANGGWDEELKKGPDPNVTQRGVEFLQKHAADQRPFALFLMYLDPHDVYHFRPQAAESPGSAAPLSRSWHEETFAGKPLIQKQFMTDNQGTVIWGQPETVWQQYREFYRQKVKLYDDQVAAIVQALRDNGLWDKTVVVSTSDHGDMDTHHRLIFKGPFMYEHMVRVPTIVRVPAACGGIGHKLVADYDWVNVDLTPTLLDLAGAPVPACDGLSAKRILLGQEPPARRPFVVGQYYGKQKWVNPIRMIRTSRYKLNVHIDHGCELYDLADDPEELKNLADDPQYAQIKQQLKEDLDRWIQQHDDPFYSLATVPLKAERKPSEQPREAAESPAKQREMTDQERFQQAAAGPWREVLADTGAEDWTRHWFLDGKVGTVTCTPQGMELTAGPEFQNDAHHMVLWTKASFAGDVKIQYEYTRLDRETRCVTILYVQATGSGTQPYAADIATWNVLREVPAMKTYFNHMHTYHVSYAAYPNDDVSEDYVRARRYMPEAQGLSGTDLAPDYFQTGLFETGVPHQITVIKRGQELLMSVQNPQQERYFRWQNDKLPPITAGRIGLRHMFTRSARYRDFRVSVRPR